MPQSIHPITVNSLINNWNENPNFFNALPEFCFIPSLGQRIKDNAGKCGCNIRQPMQDATNAFNLVVENLSDDSVLRIKTLFGIDRLCFGIQTDKVFDIKCY